MSKLTMTLAPFALALSACANTSPPAPSSALDLAQGTRPAPNAHCNRRPLGTVCVRMIDANRETPCTCIDGAAVPAMPIWPEAFATE
jgi:hypothetical protein